MDNIFIFLTILSQFLLGMYSWLVKTVPTNLSTQILARMSTYSLLAIVLGLASGHLPTTSLTHLITMGSLNAVHILSSYFAFQQLPTTVSLPIFYLYPFINVFFSSFFLNNPFNYATIPWLLLSFFGAILIVFQTGNISFSIPGLISIIIAAISESIIYLVFKSKYEPTEFQGIFHLYFGGLIATLIGRATNLIEPFDFKLETWKPLLIFNMLIGFIAFSVLTYSIPHMPTELYAALAFFGVISAFVFGELGKEKKPSVYTYLGAFMIVVSTFAIRYLKIDVHN